MWSEDAPRPSLPQGRRWGTAHPGEGRCKLHGGRSPRGSDSPHFVNGLRSRYLSPDEQQDYQRFLADFRVNPAEHWEETAALAMWRLWSLAGGGAHELSAATAGKLLNDIMRAMAMWNQAREGLTVKFELTNEQQRRMLKEIAEVVADEVEDAEVLERIATRWEEVVGRGQVAQ